ncbi:MAG TPA: hypothetical protein VHY20_06980 [Pirellulales bacterium]|nr:hypothetical protein [Pirellulales bacterium]
MLTGGVTAKKGLNTSLACADFAFAAPGLMRERPLPAKRQSNRKKANAPRMKADERGSFRSESASIRANPRRFVLCYADFDFAILLQQGSGQFSRRRLADFQRLVAEGISSQAARSQRAWR